MAINGSLVKWKWYLQERANPDIKGLSKLQEDAALSMLSPLPKSFEDMIVASLLLPALVLGESLGNNCWR